MKKFLFLDRDGVINHLVADGRAPRNIGELTIYEDAIVEIPRLCNMGYEIVVVTNQPDISRGLNTTGNVESINRVIEISIPAVSKFLICYHDNQDFCNCRKPKPGLLLTAIGKTAIEAKDSWSVGDRLTDVAAGAAVGIKTILLNRADINKTEFNGEVVPNHIAANFTEVRRLITDYIDATKI
jgi:D-glycero-D-manno-heptose 1,7-bisphosphate phosphatase